MSVYVDANVFILANSLTDSRGKRARSQLQRIFEGKKAFTSSLALDEVMWVIIRNGKKNELRSLIEDIYQINNLEVKEVPSLVPLRAIDFIESSDVRPRDAFHLAVMEHFGCDEILSDDADFDRVSGIKRIKI